MKNEAIFSNGISKSFNLLKAKLPFRRKGNSDKILLFLALGLSAFGLVMVYSASYIFAQEKFHNGLYYFNKHLIFLFLGLFSMTFFRFLDLKILEKLSLPIFIFCSMLMALTLVPGLAHRAGGASRWLNVGGFTIQPVEFIKIALVIYMASRFSKPDLDFSKITTGFFYQLAPGALIALLCMLQPDFGSTALVVAITIIICFIAGVRPKYLLTSAMVILPSMIMAIWLAPYRRARLLSFLNPWADPQGAGFQIIQSFIAFYRGGLFGVGMGNSRAKIFYLPEAHNDFILSVVGEELGFLGISILICAFLFFVFRGMRISAKSSNKFTATTAAGLTALLGLEVFWNASVVLGILPNKGMNFPFVSSGGSSIICALTAVGILLNISAQNRSETAIF